MTVSVCFYFQVHQPFRIKQNYNFFNIGNNHDYMDEQSNREILRRVARKCYLPTNKILLELIKKHKEKFNISFSISGTAIEQFEMYAPEVIESFQELVATGNVEIINETYYHSLSFLKSKKEFREQVKMHRDKMIDLFNCNLTTFRNTELIYNNDIAKVAEEMGYETILADGIDRILKWREPNHVFRPKGLKSIKLLLKNYKLSDDLAFRFSNKSWKHYPLSVKKYSDWIKEVGQKGEVVNLFMDYETFGEHQWEDSGILKFLGKLPGEILSNDNFTFQTPSYVSRNHQNNDLQEIDVKEFISWADTERDLSAWVGNTMQESALDYAYSLEDEIKSSGRPDLLEKWRKLLSSDHNYYLSTKWSNDGDVHNYFNPYNSPHDAYIVYLNVLNDLKQTLQNRIVI